MKVHCIKLGGLQASLTFLCFTTAYSSAKIWPVKLILGPTPLVDSAVVYSLFIVVPLVRGGLCWVLVLLCSN